jgi:hypothetical protein
VFCSASTGILPKGNVVDLVDETLALRTNRIWSKGRVEYTKQAEIFVVLRAFVVKKPVLICV